MAALDREHSRVLAQNTELREQLGSVHQQHVQQNEDLQAVLAEAQLALKHLRAEKVRGQSQAWLVLVFRRPRPSI